MLSLLTFALAALTVASPAPKHSNSDHGPQTRKITYGTYTIPPHEMMTIHSKIQPPCENCAITFMQAHLSYPDDSRADADTGMWMHHVVFSNLDREDGICPSARQGQRFFASGNERGPVDFSSSKDDVAYFLSSDEQLSFGGELMNMDDEEREVVFSVSWGFTQEPSESVKAVTPYWLDIGGCSSDRPAANESYFSYSSPRYTSPFSGRVVFVGTHLHDGGDKLEVLRNGKPICTSMPAYSEEGHIAQMPMCVDAGDVQKGDEWRVTADYDTYAHAPMIGEDGELEPIMGIALAYVLKDTDSPSKGKGKSHGWVVFFFILVVLAMMGGVGYILWNRRVAVWPRWAGGRQRYGALEGAGRDEGEGQAFVGDDDEDEENLWARQSTGSVRLPGGSGTK